MIAVQTYINSFLKDGFDVNGILRDTFGINFFYFRNFTFVEGEEILFARLTPGFNITWVHDNMPKYSPTPYMLDLSGYKDMIPDVDFNNLDSISFHGIDIPLQ